MLLYWCSICLYWKRAIIYKHYSTAMTSKGNTKAKQLKHFKFPFRSVLSLKKTYTHRTEQNVYLTLYTYIRMSHQWCMSHKNMFYPCIKMSYTVIISKSHVYIITQLRYIGLYADRLHQWKNGNKLYQIGCINLPI